MSQRLTDRPEYRHLQEFKRANQWQLMRKHGAHSMGIGWKKKGEQEKDQLALLFYVERKAEGAEMQAEAIPASFSYLPEGADEPVELVTDVVESPAARFEPEAAAEEED